MHLKSSTASAALKISLIKLSILIEKSKNASVTMSSSAIYYYFANAASKRGRLLRDNSDQGWFYLQSSSWSSSSWFSLLTSILGNSIKKQKRSLRASSFQRQSMNWGFSSTRLLVNRICLLCRENAVDYVTHSQHDSTIEASTLQLWQHYITMWKRSSYTFYKKANTTK